MLHKKSFGLSPKEWIVFGIPCLFLIGAFVHDLYERSGSLFLVSLFAPVNESIWEHLKLAAFPLVLWWVFYYCLCPALAPKKDCWFFACLCSLVTTLLLIPLLYYGYSQSFGVHFLWVDILILLIALAGGQLLGLHLYSHHLLIPFGVSLFLLLFLLLLFPYYTIFPPHFPIFTDFSATTFFSFLF